MPNRDDIRRACRARYRGTAGANVRPNCNCRRNSAYEDTLADSYNQGYNDGYNAGCRDGRELGATEGYQLGVNAGYCLAKQQIFYGICCRRRRRRGCC
ncbi:hypothetical protein [Clostridium sp.]|uniref:hypothetical protein n=1 Tax=Clostridium sp. TaxID=1506 RepID=UPI002605F10C|nr:hypothetical protein [Clostridium sp.]